MTDDLGGEGEKNPAGKRLDALRHADDYKKEMSPKDKILAAIKQGDLARLEQGWNEGEYHSISRDMFIAAIDAGQTRIIDFFIKNGADVADINFKNDQGDTPLMVAAKQGKVDMVKFLIEKGARLDDRNSDNHSTALIYAAQAARSDKAKALEMVQALRKAGADGSLTDSDGCTALHYAAAYGTKPMIECLLNPHASNINVQDKLDRTPLMYAAGFGNYEATHALLDHDAKVVLKDRTGWDAVDYDDAFKRCARKEGIDKSIDDKNLEDFKASFDKLLNDTAGKLQSAALPAKNITIPASPAIRDALAKYLDSNHNPQGQPHDIPLLAAVPQFLKNTLVLS